MNVRAIPRAALSGYLKLVRMPLDAAIALLLGNGRGPKPAAQLVVDRADANLRSMGGAVLGDSVLREDAERRSQAVRERAQGVRLRSRAEAIADDADARLDARDEQASKQRRRAEESAKTRRRQAEAKAGQQKRQAANREGRRREASRAIAAEHERAIEEREPREELQALDAKTEALRAREDELAARDEAQRLADAARKVKADRKSDR